MSGTAHMYYNSDSMRVSWKTVTASFLAILAASLLLVALTMERTGHREGLFLVLAVCVIAAAWWVYAKRRQPALFEFSLYLSFFLLAQAGVQLLPALVSPPESPAPYGRREDVLFLQLMAGLPLAWSSFYCYIRFLFHLAGRMLRREFAPVFIAAGFVLTASVLAGLHLLPEAGTRHPSSVVSLPVAGFVTFVLTALPMYLSVRASAAGRLQPARILILFTATQGLAMVLFLMPVLIGGDYAGFMTPTPLVHVFPLAVLFRVVKESVPGAATGIAGTGRERQFFSKCRITPREQEVIRLVASGKSNQEIETDLCISIKTVKRHLSNIFEKLEVRNRVQLVNRYLQESGGPMPPEGPVE